MLCYCVRYVHENKLCADELRIVDVDDSGVELEGANC